MSYTPIFEPETTLTPTATPAALPLHQARRTTLRFGGLSMDALTGAVTWRGALIRLPLEEREALGALMRSAGQIISSERLGAMSHLKPGTVERHMLALRMRLAEAGVTALPRMVDGLGWVLWRA